MDMNGLLGFEHLDLSRDVARDVVAETFSKIGEINQTRADLDSYGLLGFEHVDLSDPAGAEAAVADAHSKIGEAPPSND